MSVSLSLAVLTTAVKFQQMSLHHKIKPLFQLLAQRLQSTIVKLNHGVTRGTNHMMMVTAVQQNIVSCPGSLVNRADEPQLAEQFQGAVNRHAPHRWINLMHHFQQTIGCHVTATA